MIGIVLVRGTRHAPPDVRATVQCLKLKKNKAVYLDDAKLGMVKKLVNYATWGVVSEKINANKPPQGGYGSIKTPYKQGGTLGDRGEKIVELLKRMH